MVWSLLTARNRPPLITWGLGVAGLALFSLLGLYLRGESDSVLLVVGAVGIGGLCMVGGGLVKAKGPTSRLRKFGSMDLEALLSNDVVNSTGSTETPYANQSFADAKARGFTSTTFDLSENIEQGDTRLLATTELESIMQQTNLTFDEARMELTRRQMIRNDIDPDTGMPLDSKLVAW
jgi:hypothetical protein